MAEGSGTASGGGHGEWWESWKKHVRLIRAALIARVAEQEIKDLVAACLADYIAHLGTVSNEEVLATVTGRRHSSLEAAFLWLGSWRPTSAIVLVYSIMGVHVNKETQMSASNPEAPKVPVLSERQLSRINSLQVRSRRAEADASDRLADIQVEGSRGRDFGLNTEEMLVPDEELISALDLGATMSTRRDMAQAEHLVHTKLTQIRELLREANQLRQHTLQELFSLLIPEQAARCCLAGYELVFALRTLGSSSSGRIQVPPVPPSAIPVPVPVVVSAASSPTRQVIAPESLPLLSSLTSELSPSIPPLAPVPIPLLLPLSESPSPLSHLRTAASMSEAQLFANAFPVLAEQQSNSSSCPPQSKKLSQPRVLEEAVPDVVQVPPTFQSLDSEVLPVLD